MKKYVKKILVFFVALSFFLSPLSYLYAAPANTNFANDAAGAVAGTLAACLASFAGASGGASLVSSILTVPVSDFVNTGINASKLAKECSLDSLANGLKRALVRHLVDATVNWINSGFKGKPNFSISIKELGEDIKGSLLNEVMSGVGLSGLCTGFEWDLKFAIHAKFVLPKSSNSFGYTPKCTIDDIKKNIQDANQDLKNFYSWNKFLAVTTDFKNNTPAGVYYELSKRISIEQAKREERFKRDKTLNAGFLSLRECDEEAWRQAELSSVESAINSTEDEDELEMLWELHGEISNKNFEDYDGSYNAETYCPIVTPGTVLSHKLNKALGSEDDALITADEFDEIIAALIGQLLNRLSQSGGVSGFNDNGNYRDDPDPSIDSQKNSLMKKYSPEAYNIAIKILQSEKRTIERGLGVYNDAQACWNEKESGIELYREEARYSLINNYTKLTDGTIYNVKSYLGPKNNIFDRELEKVENKISQLKGERKKVIGLQESIDEIDNYFDLVNLYNSANLRGVSLETLSREKIALENNIDELVNGKVTSYTSRGKPKKTGGINILLEYCQSFDLNDDDVADDSGVSDSKEHPENYTAKELGLGKIRDKNVIDGYDPTDDIYNFQNDSGDYYIPGDEEETYRCQNSETIQCMGDLDLALEGVIDSKIDEEKIQVYTVSPENRREDGGFFILKNNDLLKRMNLSISINPEINSSNNHCNTNIYGGEEEYIKYQGKKDFTGIDSSCYLINGKTYFVRINSTKNGDYTLETRGDGSGRGEGSSGSGYIPSTPQTQECVSGNGVVCRGELGNLKINGQRYQNISGSQETPRITAGKTDVWTISPSSWDGGFVNLTFRYVSPANMVVSLSESYDKNSDRNTESEGCVKVIPGNLFFNTKEIWGQCLVDHNKTYFLRITSPEDGEYGIFW